MKVTKDQVFKLCEEVHRLKRLGDRHAKSEDWERETIASCELANSIMNNMTSIEDDTDTRTKDQVMSPAEFADRFRACEDGREWVVANCATMDDAWSTARPSWLLWIATRPGVLDDRTLRLFAVWSARQVQHLMTDPRSLAAIDAAEQHANGQATDEELATAHDVARSVAQAAAHDAARAAQAARAAAEAAQAAARAAAGSAQAAAVAAAGSAAWTASWAAAWAAADAAVDAKRAAVLAAQAAWLRENAKPDWERARQIGGAR